MKKNQIRLIGGLFFALLFIFNVSLVIIAVIKNDDIYVAYAILLSCFQFYIYHKSSLSKTFFKADKTEPMQTIQYQRADKPQPKYHEIYPN